MPSATAAIVGASEHDGHRRQRQPLAEQPREAEQRDGDVQRDERGMGHASASVDSIISPDSAVAALATDRSSAVVGSLPGRRAAGAIRTLSRLR